MDHCIAGTHPVMRAILAAVERLATVDVSVLIVGERGTGKGLLARYLHGLSGRAGRPFVRLECSEGLEGDAEPADSVLALSRAVNHSALARACDGTLLLDPVSALPAAVQERLPALLGAMPGTRRPRLVATAEGGVSVEVSSGRLTRALAEFLDPVEIPLLPLRQRRSDIPSLVEHFLAYYGARHGVGCRRVDTDAMVLLWQYDWPGNVRELEALVERLVVLTRSAVIRACDLPASVTGRAVPTHH
jgi:two-component system, NtrC family, response regulator HydG